MSKFCESCGSELNDDQKTCPNCGFTANEKKDVKTESTKVEEVKTENVGTTEQNTPKKTSGKLIGIIAGSIVAVILVVVACIALFGSNYKTPIANLCNGIQKANAKTLIKAFPDVMKSDLKDKLDDEKIEDMLEDLEDEYGKNIKISYKVLDKEKIDKDDLEDVQESLEKKYEDSKKKCKVTQGYKLTVKLTIKGKDDKDTDSTTMKVYKINGKWCFANASSLSMF